MAERWPGPGDDGTGGIFAGAFLNLSAVARALTEGSGDGSAVIVCAGRDGRFGLDDALCAGALIRAVEAQGAEPVLNDAASAARRLVDRPEEPAALLADTAAARYLTEIGRAEDIAFCAQVDRTALVPRFRDRKITAE